MGVPEEHTPDFGPLQVDLPDLRGYAGLTDQLSQDLGAIATMADVYCRDADFGKIVEDLTEDYATLLPQLKTLLDENETVMRAYARALDRGALNYERTDDGVAAQFDGDGITGGGGTNAAKFRPSSPVDYMQSPYPTESSLPEVSFGFVFDKLAWALETFCNWDVRREVTDWIAGDVVDLSTQARCWELISQRLECVRVSLNDGNSLVTETWTGYASAIHSIELIGWDTALTTQRDRLKELGAHLAEVAKEAVNVAQFVVDCIRLAIDLILSAWALQYIPVYGQAKFIQKAWHAYKTANKAVAYLKMLVSLIRTVKSFLVMCYDQLTPSMLPGKPQSVTV